MKSEVIWQRIEGAAIFLAGMWVYQALGGGFGWWAILLFFAPDLSFAGYFFGSRIGAFCYNLVHIYAFGLVAVIVGSMTGSSALMALGALWFSQSGFDRMLGYGLKTDEGFRHTHLGRIGRRN